MLSRLHVCVSAGHLMVLVSSDSLKTFSVSCLSLHGAVMDQQGAPIGNSFLQNPEQNPVIENIHGCVGPLEKTTNILTYMMN